MQFEYHSQSEDAAPERVWHLIPLERLLRSFSSGDRLVLYVLSVLLAGSALALLAGLSYSLSVTAPAHGGSLTEGEVGPARFINPLLTMSQPDEDLAALVYSGLMRAAPDGGYIPDLASTYEISSDGTTYTFHLRKGATFQDGTPVGAADVLFTIAQAQNPDIKSGHRADWDGVRVSSPDASTIVFTLPHAYAPFMEDTTLGILPKHLWQNVSAEEFPFSPLNTHPIGSGPYKIASVQTDSTGSATRYDLIPFQQFALGAPYLSKISLLFYASESELIDAWNNRRVDAIAGVAPTSLNNLSRTDANIVRAPLPRTFGIFFNQNHAPALTDASVRAALNAAVDKQNILRSVLGGYGVALDGPIPPSALGKDAATPSALAIPAIATSSPQSTAAQNARALLTTGGWSFLPVQAGDTGSGTWTKSSKKETLSFTLATADEPELVATANSVAQMWKAAGINVAVQVYPIAELNSSVIRPRNYDAILFGEVVGRSPDLFAFWHSSQRNDPGLNLAMYANSKADALLAQARGTSDATARDKLYNDFAAIVQKDQPAVFIYAPEFLYIVPENLSGVKIGALTTPSERFLNVYQWYTNTERVWSIFSTN